MAAINLLASVGNEPQSVAGMVNKDRINVAINRLTGYHLVRGRPGEPCPHDAAVIARLREQIAQQRRRVERLQNRVKHFEERGVRVPRDIDDAARATITAVRPWTMTGTDKLFDLIQAVRYVARHSIAGDIVECGVWRGGSMQAAARTLLEVGDTNRELYLFDTFEGMPPPTDHDVRGDGRSAAELLHAKDREHSVWAYATLDDVRAGFAGIPYPSEKVHFVPGRVEETIPAQMPERIAILRLDTDWYESTDHELRHMYDHLVPGGVLFLDDYGHWAGSQRATDEFLERTGEPLLLLRMGTGRVAVKPLSSGR